jgi:gas vesicle protein
MKLSDIKDFSKDDILAALGLEMKSTFTSRMLGTLGIFGCGLLVGAGAALILAPKSGSELREDLGERFRKMRTRDDGTIDESDAAQNAAAGLSGAGLREDSIRT